MVQPDACDISESKLSQVSTGAHSKNRWISFQMIHCSSIFNSGDFGQVIPLIPVQLLSSQNNYRLMLHSHGVLRVVDGIKSLKFIVSLYEFSSSAYSCIFLNFGSQTLKKTQKTISSKNVRSFISIMNSGRRATLCVCLVPLCQERRQQWQQKRQTGVHPVLQKRSRHEEFECWSLDAERVKKELERSLSFTELS